MQHTAHRFGEFCPACEIVVYVNGYGTPRDPQTDGNLGRYLPTVRDFARAHSRAAIFLCGGLTNRTDLSEAAAMAQWFALHAEDLMPRIKLLEDGVSPHQNVTAFAQIAGFKHAVLFCEESRTPTMRFLAWYHLHGSSTVTGVPFDKRSLTLRHRLVQWTSKLGLEVLATYFPPVDRLRKKLREQHIAKARARANA
jgi:hypothetical protein